MSKRFECPICGAGVKPTDKDCFRCGGSLEQAPAPTPAMPKLLDDKDLSQQKPSGEE